MGFRDHARLVRAGAGPVTTYLDLSDLEGRAKGVVHLARPGCAETACTLVVRETAGRATDEIPPGYRVCGNCQKSYFGQMVARREAAV